MLFGKLQQGIIENQQVLQVAKLRADAEDRYGGALIAITGGGEKYGGFSRDDGASVRKVCAILLSLAEALSLGMILDGGTNGMY